MIPYEEALDLLTRSVPPPRRRRVPLADALGRVLAEDVAVDRDIPPFDKVVMDGYAVRWVDLERGWRSFRLVGTAVPGTPCPVPIGPGEAVRVATGAPLPRNADTVVVVEHAEMGGDKSVVVLQVPDPGAHVVRRGEEHRAGALALPGGVRLSPARLAVLASVGCTDPLVFTPPRISILTTGGELVRPQERPGPYEIRDSNATFLASLARQFGLPVTDVRHCLDDPTALRTHLETPDWDCLLITGGVSMGHVDFVPTAVEAAGFVTLFHKVAIRPGKPILAARREDRVVLALPGNPVSAAVGFLVLGLPLFHAWEGQTRRGLPWLKAKVLEPLRLRPGRRWFRPARLEVSEDGNLGVRLTPFKGSADLISFASADALLTCPPECEEIPKGAPVDVIPLLGGAADVFFPLG
ncbi:MAG: molybdopterin molybdotransferase MoeA [Acidobacteriota bacterium]